MYCRTARLGVASLALVLTLLVFGAPQPAAAADRGHSSHFDGFWASLLDTIPGARAVQHVLANWLPFTEKSTTQPPSNTDQGWGIDPNGVSLSNIPVQPRPTSGN